MARETTTGTSTNPLKYGSPVELWRQYSGGYQAPAGLYHFGQRYYDPADARWTQPDPLDQPDDLRQGNRYVYVGGDPIDVTDLTGLTAPANPTCNRGLHAKGESRLPRCKPRRGVLPGFRAAAGLFCGIGAPLIGSPHIGVACAYDAILEAAKLISED